MVDVGTAGGSSRSSELVGAALEALGVERLLFAIQDASFPSDPDEDVGRGAPGAPAAARLTSFVRRLGFTGLQLGPQGQTARDNPSPYDGTIFSRAVESIPLSTFVSGRLAGTVTQASLQRSTREGQSAPGARVDHARAHDAMHGLLDEAFVALERSPRAAITEALAGFRAANAGWLERDALYAAISAAEGGASFHHWRSDGDLFAQAPSEGGRHQALAALHRRAIDRYALGQLLAHEAHAAFRDVTARQHLTLHADLQTGLSAVDTWGWRYALLPGYAMGAPPSRTTRAGQPWGYPVLDPDGPGLELLAMRFDKAFLEHDAVRIDHPHSLVCPWVYRIDTGDPGEAVRAGARLFESPDLPDHPALARYAIARPGQIDHSAQRHADDWVRELAPDQVERYAATVDLLVATARRHGRGVEAIACEVLSTMPRPLELVMERAGLGRFRVIQKANPDDPRDVYRPENARREDWIMLGTHDTPSIWAAVRGLSAAQRQRWAAHLAGALRLSTEDSAALAEDRGLLVHAMLAEMFASAAENVLVFFTDLFGYEERYNEPGTISPDNWSLRLPGSFEPLYEERVARGEALDLPLALAMALEARDDPGADRAALAGALRELSAWRQVAVGGRSLRAAARSD